MVFGRFLGFGGEKEPKSIGIDTALEKISSKLLTDLDSFRKHLKSGGNQLTPDDTLIIEQFIERVVAELQSKGFALEEVSKSIGSYLTGLEPSMSPDSPGIETPIYTAVVISDADRRAWDEADAELARKTVLPKATSETPEVEFAQMFEGLAPIGSNTIDADTAFAKRMVEKIALAKSGSAKEVADTEATSN